MTTKWKTREIIALGIESSCDDTAAGVVKASYVNGCLESVRVLSSETWSQDDRHAGYGGIVPEIAARSHVERIDTVIADALKAAAVTPEDLSLVAATGGPGLVGGVMVGLSAAKGFALAQGLPLVPVNHLEGHALSVRLTEVVRFPYLLLLISGGHTQLIRVDGVGAYTRLGTTIDDAAGEAFDKTAKLLGLGQPGGPKIESIAASGRPSRFDLPMPLKKRAGCDFSFSGLKTAVRNLVEEEVRSKRVTESAADIAAAFQEAVADHLSRQTGKAMASFFSPDSDHADNDGEAPVRECQKTGVLVVAGGVAANCAIKSKLAASAKSAGWRLAFPPAKYCTDNGAMIALAGAERCAAGLVPTQEDALSFAPRARWPLAPPIEGAEHGGGRKGPKA
ncbi:MAG: tRNA (adenosine(37)-N6)-threonylcarbamoyltransferase complex transferase subunit TsaD [Pseudomonadota bacterium]